MALSYRILQFWLSELKNLPLILIFNFMSDDDDDEELRPQHPPFRLCAHPISKILKKKIFEKKLQKRNVFDLKK